MTAVVRTERLGVRFPGAAADAVRDISIDLRAGETVAVLGPSGSGKSTVALALVGAIPTLIPATRHGTVDWASGPAPTLAAGTGRAAFVMQNSDAQLVALTVEDELAFALENRGLGPNAIDARIDATLAHAPVAGLNRRDRTLTLSAGWRQRLGLAAALAEAPECLVIDEPVAHLDERAAGDAVAAIADATRDRAALLIEHRADLVAPIAARALVLDGDGTPAEWGPTDTVLAAVASRPGGLGLRLPPALVVAAALGSDERPERAVEALGFDALAASATSPGPALLTLSDVTVHRGRRAVLEDIDLVMHSGEIVGVTGPNGAGKTTLAFLAAGALRAKRGHVTRRGPPPVYVPQNPTLAFASGRLQHEATRRAIDWSRAAALIEAHGVVADPTRHPLAYSHGEMRRIAVSFALAVDEPRLLIFDEPTAGLDGGNLRQLRADLRDARARGCAVLVVAHDLDWLATTADRVVVVDKGRIVADAPSAQIVQRALASMLPIAAPPAARLLQTLGWRPC